MQYIKLAVAECGYGTETVPRRRGCRWSARSASSVADAHPQGDRDAAGKIDRVSAAKHETRVRRLVRPLRLGSSGSAMQRIHVIDSHTGGEPTRVVVAGGPDLGRGPLAERASVFRERFDAFRSAVVNEPRGSDVLVGALLCEPHDPACAAGVIFFNNVGNLGMCGHGTIGVGGHAGAPGPHRRRASTASRRRSASSRFDCTTATTASPSRTCRATGTRPA